MFTLYFWTYTSIALPLLSPLRSAFFMIYFIIRVALTPPDFYILVFSHLLDISTPASLKCTSTCGIPHTCPHFFIRLGCGLHHSPEPQSHLRLAFFPEFPTRLVISYQSSPGRLIHAHSFLSYLIAIAQPSLPLTQFLFHLFCPKHTHTHTPQICSL